MDSEGTLTYLELQSLDLPIKIMDDVNSISEWTFMNDNTALILNNSGELFEFSLTHIDDGDTYKPQYSISKITDDVKLADPIERKEQTIYFKDISDKTTEEQKAINSLCKAGITEGTNETTFSPDKEVTRAETAALLLRMSAVPETDGDGFSDVTADNWYYGTASTSKKYGIVKGYEDNTFRGDENVSALQFISLNARVLKNERNVEAKNTVDVPYNIPEWYRNDIRIALKEGLITEEELDGFLNNGSITRAEAAVILYRLYDRI
jgi:hypothetical protein